MPETPNHGYNVPEQGQDDWAIPLNENFRQYDTDIEIRDVDANKSDYDPKDGAKFFATNTGRMYTGDGTDWNELAATGDEPTVNGAVYAQRARPNASQLADGEGMIYNADGSGAHASGDLIYALNDGGTIRTEPIVSFSGASGRRFSFEEATPGSGQLPSPWSVIRDDTPDGFDPVEISTEHATHGTQTLHMSGNGELDRILVGFVADLSDVEMVRCDVYIERANVSFGEVRFGHWNEGDYTRFIGFLGQTGGDGTSRFDTTGEFTDLEVDFPELSGEHKMVFNVRGDNEAYFDNLRFLDGSGNLVSPLE